VLGSQHDNQILEALRLSPLSTSRLARDVGVDDGALTQRLINVLLKDGLVEVSGAAGSTPIWDLTQKGRDRIG
jgi:DNA-binding HxlR family transcriptional regulator